MAWGTNHLGSTGEYGLDFISVWMVHSSTHAHSADNVIPWNPPDVPVHSSVHAHTAENVGPIPPQTSLLRNLDAVHSHRVVRHFYRFDFQYAAPKDITGGVVRFNFSGAPPVYAGAQDFFESGTFSVQNLAQGVFLGGFAQTLFQPPVVGPKGHRIRFAFRGVGDTTPPITFDFVENTATLLILHNSRLTHQADQQNVNHQTPLASHDCTQAQAADHLDVTHRSPLIDLLSVHEHTAAQVTIRHEITLTAINAAQQAQIAQNLDLTHRSPANAASSTHSHTAEGLQITHTSPLNAHLTLHEVDDDLSAIINRSVLVAAGANHDHYSEHFALTHFSPLAISDPWHYHRVQRLNFLPEGWVFRALLDIGEADRVIVMDSDNRTAEIPASKSRELEIPAENRVLDVPPEVRELVLEPQGRVSSIGG